MAQRAHGGLCQRRTAAEDEDDREHACERQLARQVRAKLCGEGHHAELDAFDEDEEADDHGHQPEEHLARVEGEGLGRDGAAARGGGRGRERWQ